MINARIMILESNGVAINQIDEWSVENMHFYKETLLLQLLARNCIGQTLREFKRLGKSSTDITSICRWPEGHLNRCFPQ